MHARSLTNSRKHENLTLRRKYAAENKLDEIRQAGILLMEVPFTEIVLAEGGFQIIPKLRAQETHHILGSLFGSRRHDILSNLIRLHLTTHRWATRYKHDGIALCCLAKLRKGEFDPAALEKAYGLDNFARWFSTLESKLQFEVGRSAWQEVSAFLKTLETKESTNGDLD